MKKKVLFLAWALQLVPAIMMAQGVVEVVDSAKVDPLEGMLIEVYENEDGIEVRDTFYFDNPAEDSIKMVKIDLKECDSVEVCKNPKYAIISKNGKKAIYDMLLNQLVTAVEYDELGFSCCKQAGADITISIFYTKIDNKEGMFSVSDLTKDVISIWKDESDNY